LPRTYSRIWFRDIDAQALTSMRSSNNATGVATSPLAAEINRRKQKK